MVRVLVSWIGNTDLNAPTKPDEVGLGPVAQAVSDRAFDEIVLLNNYRNGRVNDFIKWLQARTQSKILLHNIPLSSPAHFGEIYQGAVGVVSEVIRRHGPSVDLTFHLSPGTSQMAAVWVILSKTRFPAELIEEVASGNFRADLFYRLAVVILQLSAPDGIEVDKDLCRRL